MFTDTRTRWTDDQPPIRYHQVTTIRFISGAAALSNFINGIHAGADEGLDDRGINASGALKKSNRTDVVPSLNSTSAHLYALDYWKTAGSGQPPGTNADLQALFEWAKVKGIASNDRRAARIALFTKAKILSEGSKQYREGGENVYEKAVEASQPKIPAILMAFLSDYKQPLASEFKRALA